MDAHEASEFCARWLPAWTGNDPERLLAFYTEDAFYSDPALPDGIEGHAALLDYFGRLLRRYPDWTWQHDRSLPLPDGFLNYWTLRMPAAEGEIRISGVCVVRLREGRIYRNEVFFDRSALLAASRPAEPTRAETAIQSMEVTASTTSLYPPVLAARVAGREKRALGDHFGLRNFGVNLTTLPPGAQSALRHAHSKQDELIYILEGRPTLRDDSGARELGPGMVVGFPAGMGNAHHLVNESDAPAVYLEVGDRTPGDRVNYPDDDLLAVEVDGRWRFSRKDGALY